MKIKLEDFKKLKQLDRIEYILRYNRIGEKNQANCVFHAFIFFLFFLSFMILITITGYSAFGETFSNRFLQSLGLAIKIFYIWFLLAIILDVVAILNNYKAKKQLFNEYFKIETKKKND